MADSWYCRLPGKKPLGPLSGAKLKALADAGRLSVDHEVSRQPAGPWVAASKVKGLFAEEAPARSSRETPAQMPVAKPLAEAKTSGKPSAKRLPPAEVPRSQGVPLAETLEGADASAELPRAKRSSSPPAVSTAEPVVPETAVLVAAKAEAHDPFHIETEPPPSGSGTSDVSAIPPRKKKDNTKLVIFLVVLVLGLGVAAIVLPQVFDGFGGEDEEQASNRDESGSSSEEPREDGNPSPESGSSSDSAATSNPPPESKWVDASMESGISKGSVKVRIISATLGLPKGVRSKTDASGKPKRYLILDMLLENLDAEKKIEYSRWSGRNQAAAGVKLSDDKGNKYNRVILARRTAEGSGESLSIYPNEPIEDEVIFQRPVETANYLRLELPAEAFGETGSLFFEIPRQMIAEAAGPSDPADEDPMPSDDESLTEIERGIRDIEEESVGHDEPGNAIEDFPDDQPSEDDKDGPSLLDENPELRGDAPGGEEGPGFEGMLDQFPSGRDAPDTPRKRNRGRD